MTSPYQNEKMKQYERMNYRDNENNNQLNWSRINLIQGAKRMCSCLYERAYSSKAYCLDTMHAHRDVYTCQNQLDLWLCLFFHCSVRNEKRGIS
jgi:hypothetical protein